MADNKKAEWKFWTSRGFCGRCTKRAMAAPGHKLCEPCLDYMLRHNGGKRPWTPGSPGRPRVRIQTYIER